ncbi:hypothetical protein BH24ACT5_BH24ACT5_14300 [soil metagenome]
MSPSTGPRYSDGPSVELARIWSAAAHRVRRTSARSVVSTRSIPLPPDRFVVATEL